LGIDLVRCLARPALIMDRHPQLPLFCSCFLAVGVQSSIALATRLWIAGNVPAIIKGKKTSEFQNHNRIMHDTVVCFKLWKLPQIFITEPPVYSAKTGRTGYVNTYTRRRMQGCVLNALITYKNSHEVSRSSRRLAAY
jgi:hypothetical protein